ncbi:MAG: tetratricopeptide repeat protein, partial [Candidatus Poribacteria bacterium]|nr:tetratricopeptide repeat protein [Candidatus Poribacteria bacterium]
MENTKNGIENPTSAEAYVNRGDKLYDQGDYQAAISDYDAAIHINPEHALAYNNRGNAKSQLGK